MRALAAFLPPDTSCQLLAIPVGVCPNVKARKQTQSGEVSCLRLYSSQAMPMLHAVLLSTCVSGQAIYAGNPLPTTAPTAIVSPAV